MTIAVQNGVEVFVGVCCVHDGIVLRGCLIEVLEVVWCYLMLCCVNCWEIVLNLVSLLLVLCKMASKLFVFVVYTMELCFVADGSIFLCFIGVI